jgi:hypothetical protein
LSPCHLVIFTSSPPSAHDLDGVACNPYEACYTFFALSPRTNPKREQGRPLSVARRSKPGLRTLAAVTRKCGPEIQARLQPSTFASGERTKWSITSRRAAGLGPRWTGFGKRGFGGNPCRGEAFLGAGGGRKRSEPRSDTVRSQNRDTVRARLLLFCSLRPIWVRDRCAKGNGREPRGLSASLGTVRRPRMVSPLFFDSPMVRGSCSRDPISFSCLGSGD